VIVDNGREVVIRVRGLAKSFGSDSSAKFVNGVLGSVSLSLAG